MAKHAVVRTDNLTGTDVRSQLVSIRYMGADGNTATEIDNGHVVKVGALEDGQREVYVGTDVAADTDLADVVLIASVETMYDEHKKNLDEFVNEAGAICRGYRLNGHGDTFSVTAEALDGTPAVDAKVTLAAGTKLTVAASTSSESGISSSTTATTVGTIIAEEVAGRYTYYVIRID